MKHLICTLLLIAAGLNNLPAQKKITMKGTAGTSYNQMLPPDMLCEYTTFKPGKLIYKNGSVTKSEFNYDLTTNSLLFKSNTGEALAFAFPEQITMVQIDSTIWIPLQQGFGKIIYSKGNFHLVKYRTTVCTGMKKEGAFGTNSNTSSITSISSVTGGDNMARTLSISGEYDFETKVHYYLKKGEDQEYANQKGFKKLLPDSKDAIGTILKANKLNFNKEEDLIKFIKLLNIR